MNKFEVLSVIGEGAYGIVLRCKDVTTGQLVAIKKFKESDEDEMVRRTTLREVKMLRMLRQDNIVELKEAFRRKNKLYLVFEYVPKTLLEVLEARRGDLSPEEVRQYIYQLVQAVNWIHSHNAVHRDIKPENLLISPGTSVGQLKLCDFGFARQLPLNAADASITDYVSTRWYRSPELLLGSSHYGKEVDVWAIGCIMAELATGQPLFPGDSDIDQLYIVQKMLGPLCRQHDILFLKNRRFAGLKFPDMSRPTTLEARLRGAMSGDALDCIRGMLCVSPTQRLTCLQCLEHPYLADLALRDPKWQQQLRQHVATGPAAAAATGAPSSMSNSSASSATRVEGGGGGSSNSTAESGSSSACMADPAPGMLQQQQQARHYVNKAQTVPKLQLPLQQQQHLHAAGSRGLPSPSVKPGGGAAIRSNAPSKQPTPRMSLPPPAASHGAALMSQVPPPQQQLQALGSNSNNSSRQLAVPPRLQPVGGTKKLASRGPAAGPAAAAGRAIVPQLQLSSKGLQQQHQQQQQQPDGTPRSRAAGAAPVARGPNAPATVTRAKAASMAAALGGGAGAAGCYYAGGAAGSSPRALAGATAQDGDDADMPDADGALTARRRKRLASGNAAGSSSIRAGRREVDLDEVPGHRHHQAGGGSGGSTALLPALAAMQAAPAAGAGRTRLPGSLQQQQLHQQQPWVGGAVPSAINSTTNTSSSSRMDVDVPGLGSSSGNSSRPQSPLGRASLAGGDAASPAGTAAAGLLYRWGQQQQQQQDAAAPAAAAAAPGFVVCPASSHSFQQLQGPARTSAAAVPCAAGGRWSSMPGNVGRGCGTGVQSGVGAGGHGAQHVGGFGMATAGMGSWGDDAAALAAAAAAVGMPAGLGCVGPRASLASGLPMFEDALSGLQASTCGAQAPLCSSLAAGGYKGRSSIDLQRPAASCGAGAAGAAASPGPASPQQQGPQPLPPGGQQQQQQQQYLHQHLYH